MKITKVHIKNLNSLRGEQAIDFLASPLSDTGLFAITGDTGAGKTTILDAITLALYGRVHRNKEVREVLSFGAVDCFAEVEFEAQQQRYRAKWSIWRARQNTDGNILGPARELARWSSEKETFEILADKIREVDTLVEEVCGLDFDRFSRSVLLSQGDFAAFLKANEKERSDLLERITGTEIYSQLSQAAFRRHKLEKEKLEQLQQQQQSLRLLDKATLKEKKKLKKEYTKESQSLKKELDQLRQQLQWWTRMEELRKRQQQLQTGIGNLEKELQERQEDFAALDQHLKTQIFAPKLAYIGDEENQLQSLAEEIQVLQNQIEHLQQEEQNAKIALEECHLIYQKSKKEQEEKGALIETVQKLDLLIEEKEKPILQKEAEAQQLKNQQAQAETQLAKSKEKHQQWLQKEQKLKESLLDKSKEQLQEQLGEMRPLLRNTEGFLVEGKKVKEELLQEEALCQKEIKAKEKIEKDLVRQQKEWQTVVENFKNAAPKNYASTPEELLDLLGTEIESLSEQRNNLLQFNNLYGEYQNLLREQLTYEEKLENLRTRESHLNSEVLNSLDMVDILAERLEFKQQIYEQQQLIANYERDRSELQPGMPCPVCQSTEHPFRHQHFKPYLHEARKEYEVARQQHEQILRHHRQLLLQQERIAQEIESLAGQDGRDLGGQVQNVIGKILNYENKIASIFPVLPQKERGDLGQKHLQDQISNFEVDLVRKKQQKQKLAQLKDDWLQQEKLVQQLQEALKDQQRKIDSHQERIKFIEEKRAERLEQYQKAAAQLNLLLDRYDLKYDPKQGDKQLEQLQEQLKTWEKMEKEAQEAGEQARLLEQQLLLEQKQMDLQETALQKLTVQIQTDRLAITDIVAERKTLMGDRKPEEEKKRLQELVQSAEVQKEQAQKKLEAIGASLKNIQGQHKAQSNSWQKQSKLLEREQADLLGKIQAIGFESLEELRAAQLSERQTKQWIADRERLQQSKWQQEQSLQDVQADLEKLLADLADQPEQQALMTRQNELDQRYQELLQNIGGIESELQYQQQLEAEAQQLLLLIDAQRQEYNRWAKLNEIIGSADGKRFRIFAQSLTLQKLCQLANKHLKSLDGRYWIEKPDDQDLALAIIDTYQADNRRSMNTLSGGESFLVSLALALGLSDLAGRNTQIQSLFIDEGFGTLDDASLDMAISTLENLQVEGKTIGVISHVKELKERIATQIQVKKNGNGFSELKIV